MQDFCATFALFIFGFVLGVMFTAAGFLHDAKRTGNGRDKQ